MKRKSILQDSDVRWDGREARPRKIRGEFAMPLSFVHALMPEARYSIMDHDISGDVKADKLIKEALAVM